MARGLPSFEVSASFTRPADTTQYASGDLVANNTTAGSVTLLSWDFGTLGAGDGIWLRRLLATKSDPDITGASFRLWLHNDSAVTFSNGDNGALAIASSTLPIANVSKGQPIDFDFDFTLTGAGDVGVATWDTGLIWLPPVVYGFLEARGTYTPGNAEVFTIYLRGDPY